MTSSPPGQSRHIPETKLRAVLVRFGVENPVAIEPLEASKRNDNFLVGGTDGKYVLRRYRRNNDEARVRFQLRFQQHLLDSGFPTSTIILTHTGDPLVAEDGGLWSLFGHVEGSEHDFARREQVVDAARRLAQFHRIAETFTEPEVVCEVNREWCDWWSEGEREMCELALMFEGRSSEAELAFLRDWWSRSIREWPAERVESLPRGWIHGDYHGRNMVFVNDQIRGIVDFDPVRRGVIVEDISRAVFMFARESRSSRHIRPDVASAFVKEYQRGQQMSAEELNAIPFVMVADLAPTPAYYRMIERDGEDSVDYIRHAVGLMRDLQSAAETLRAILNTAQ
jgi:Ser/Thr protein kinase RdoA (MazF antagonist)